jgi:integrative and conjugative element protein (TIGR02256 family)
VETEQIPQYFVRTRDGSLKLGSDALATMLGHAQLAPDAAEAGGVLMGRHIIGTRDVVVDRVTTPMRGDRRSRMAFTRRKRRHQQVLDEEWERSGGTRVYLGEWHTHPEPIPMPSGVDMDDWRRRLQEDIVEARSVFFLIVGQLEIRAWEGSRRTFGVVPLRRRTHLLRY